MLIARIGATGPMQGGDSGVITDHFFTELNPFCISTRLARRDVLAVIDNRRRDRAAQRTLEGPHRDELDVVHAAKRVPAAHSSTELADAPQ